MAETTTSLVKARKGIRLAVGTPHKVTLTPFAAHHLELLDAFFRTGSATVLPEGETPAGASRGDTGVTGGKSALTSVGAFATLLRFNEENPGRKLLIAGHTDTEGGQAENKRLSEDRGKAVHALLMGERQAFADLAEKRHKVSDYKQILKWASVALADLEPPGGGAPAASFIDCDPGKIDDDEFTGIEPIKAFQRAYNANKQALEADGEDLKVDGAMGPKTWGAVFDCYEFGLRQELGEDKAALAELRGKVTFLISKRPAVGFGESRPVEGAGTDGLSSQRNRRVEALFFGPDEEPDLDVLEKEPEKSEIYPPGVFARVPIPPLKTAARTRVELKLQSRDGHAIPDVAFVATISDGTERKGRLGNQGRAVIKVPPDATFQVEYLDHDDIRAKALAARLSKALDAGEHAAVTGALAVAGSLFQAMKAAVEKFFPRPGDLIEEIRAKTKGTPSADAAAYFLIGLGFGAPDGSPGELIAFDERSSAEKRQEGTAVV